MNYTNGQTGGQPQTDAKSFKGTKSDPKSTVSKIEGTAGSAADSASGFAHSVLTSAFSFLPIKNADEAVSMLQTTVKDIQSNLQAARSSATSFVKKYPVYSLLGAAAFGAVAVMIFNSRRPTAAAEAKYDA